MLNKSQMSSQYLTQKLSQLTSAHLKKSYWRAYQLKRIQRFLISTCLVFFLQYLTLIHLTTYPFLPMYPPIGSAFVMLYLLGDTALLGLFLASFCAYCMHGLPLPSLLLSITADLGGGYLIARWCRSVFTSDHSVFTNIMEWLRFVLYASIGCFLSGLLRMGILHDVTVMSPQKLGYDLLRLWMADLNASIVFSGFFLTWISVYLGRERVLTQKTTLFHKICWVLWGLSCVLFLKNIAWLILAIILSLYFSHRLGVLVAVAVSYVLTTLFLVCFVFHQADWIQDLGLQMYTLIPFGVLCFLLAMLYVGVRIARRH